MFACTAILANLRASLAPARRRVEGEFLLQRIYKVRWLIDAWFWPGISKNYMSRCNRNLEYLRRTCKEQGHGLQQLHAIDETQQLIVAWFPLGVVEGIFTCSFILDDLSVSLTQANRHTEGKESVLSALQGVENSIYGWFPPGTSKELLAYSIRLNELRASLIQAEWRGGEGKRSWMCSTVSDLIP